MLLYAYNIAVGLHWYCTVLSNPGNGKFVFYTHRSVTNPVWHFTHDFWKPNLRYVPMGQGSQFPSELSCLPLGHSGRHSFLSIVFYKKSLKLTIEI